MSLFTQAHIDQLKKAAGVNPDSSVTIIEAGNPPEKIEIHSQDSMALHQIADYLKQTLNIRRAGDYPQPQAKIIKTGGRPPHLALAKNWQSGGGKAQEDEIGKLYSHLNGLLEQEVKNYLNTYLFGTDATAPPRFVYHPIGSNEIMITRNGNETSYNVPIKRAILASPGYDVDQKSYDEPLRSLLIYFSQELQKTPKAKEITYPFNLRPSAVAANPLMRYPAPPPPLAPVASTQPPRGLVDLNASVQQIKLAQQQTEEAQRRREALAAQQRQALAAQQRQALAAQQYQQALVLPPPVWTSQPQRPILTGQATTLPSANAAPSVPPPPPRPPAVTPSVSARATAISGAASVSTSTTTSSSQSQWMTEAQIWENLHKRKITQIFIERRSENNCVWLTFGDTDSPKAFYNALQPLISEAALVEHKSFLMLSFASAWLLSLSTDSVTIQGLKDIRQFCENYCKSNATLANAAFNVADKMQATAQTLSTTSTQSSSTSSTVPPPAPLLPAITTSSVTAAASAPAMPESQPAAVATVVSSVATMPSPPPRPIAPQRPSVGVSSSVYAPATPIAPAASFSLQPPATTEADMWESLHNRNVESIYITPGSANQTVVWLTFKNAQNCTNFYNTLESLSLASSFSPKAPTVLSFASSWLLSLSTDSAGIQELKDIRQFCENYCRNNRAAGQSFKVATYRVPSTTSTQTSSTGSTVSQPAPLPPATTTSSVTAAASAPAVPPP